MSASQCHDRARQWGGASFSIAQRISLSSGFLCLVIAAISAFAVNRVYSLNKISDSIVGDSLPGVIAAGTIFQHQTENQLLLVRMLLTKTAEERTAIKTEVAENAKIVADAVQKYEPTINAEDDRRNFEALKAEREIFIKNRDQFYALIETDLEAAKTFNAGHMLPACKKFAAAIDVVYNYNAKAADQRGKLLSAEVSSDVRAFVIVGAVSLAIGIAASVFIVITIGKVLRRVASTIADGAEQTSSAASQVSSSSQSMAEGASEQAASLEETSASLEEMASMTKRNAESANEAKELSSETRAAADTGAADMGEMKQAMDAIKASGDDISKIIKTIDEIAFQTNILALNAAVEAARAGEAGAGFAVVAEEVRNLAQRSAQSAKETASKIEDSIKKSEHGVRISDKVAKSLGEIVEKARKMDSLVAEIAGASQEQTTGITQVNIAVSQMDKVTQANAGSAEETAAAAEELSAQAVAMQEATAELRQLVGGARSSAKPATARIVSPKNSSNRKPVIVTRSSAGANGHHGESSPAPSRGQKKLEYANGSANGHSNHDEFFKNA